MATAIANPEDEGAFTLVPRGEGWTVASGGEQIAPKQDWSQQDALLVRFGLAVGLVRWQQFEWESRPAQGVEEAR